jgi:hypothetical protein
VVVVDSQRFERSHSQEVARPVAYFNAKLASENRPYLLIGAGPLGLEGTLAGRSRGVVRNLRCARDRGSRLPRFSCHAFAEQPFFSEPHRVPGGIFTVNPDLGEGSVDWKWLSAQPFLESAAAYVICASAIHCSC